MELKEKLLAIQQELKVPKGRKNKFGKFKYRSADDILTALKPLLDKHKVLITISDALELIGDRYYVKSIVCLDDAESDSGFSVSAYARESLERVKFDDAQLTGSASSYARKYALGGLFLIDDNQDPDAIEDDPEDLEEEEPEEKPARKPRTKKADPDPEDHDRYFYLAEENNVILVHAGDPDPEDGVEINDAQYKAASTAIARAGRGRKKLDLERIIKESDFMNIPETDEEEVPFVEDKPATRRTRRKRS